MYHKDYPTDLNPSDFMLAIQDHYDELLDLYYSVYPYADVKDLTYQQIVEELSVEFQNWLELRN